MPICGKLEAMRTYIVYIGLTDMSTLFLTIIILTVTQDSWHNLFLL